MDPRLPAYRYLLLLAALFAPGGTPALGGAPAAGGALPTQADLAKLVADDAVAGDRFGWSAAASGEIAVVGAYFSHPGGLSSGAVYVYRRDQGGPGEWGLVKRLLPSDVSFGFEFGVAVAIDGDTLLVGAPSVLSRGAAYVFARNQGGTDNWGEVKKLVANDAEALDRFGEAVALSGDLALVGATGDDDGGASSGSAYLFARHDGGADSWGQVDKLMASDPTANALFGSDLALDGGTALVGARGDDAFTGAAYVFVEDPDGAGPWTQARKLTAFDGGDSQQFGSALALDGTTALVGAPDDDDLGGASGSIYIFERDLGGEGAWGLRRKRVASDGASSAGFGWSLALEGDFAVVSAPGLNQTGGLSGVAFLLGRDQGGADQWGEVKKLVPGDLAAGDQNGVAVAFGGGTVVTGSWANDDAGSASGSAYVFAGPIVFSDGFESGDTSAWSLLVP